jgi:hypothetical protein
LVHFVRVALLIIERDILHVVVCLWV